MLAIGNFDEFNDYWEEKENGKKKDQNVNKGINKFETSLGSNLKKSMKPVSIPPLNIKKTKNNINQLTINKDGKGKEVAAIGSESARIFAGL